MPATSSKKTAILYDFLQVQGGAEAVTLDLCHHFPQLDLITAFINPAAFPEPPLPTQRIRALTTPTALQGWQTIKSCKAFTTNTQWLGDYHSLIFSGSNAPLAVCNSQAEKNIYYCHTPPRFVYDLKTHYLSTTPLWQRPLLHGLIRYLRPRFEQSMKKMDVIYANSINVQNRLKHYLNIDSQVLYPPCRVDRFRWQNDGDYYLSTARLEEYKRVDLIVRAFKAMPDKKLIVASGGSQLSKLKHLADGAQNISFTGWVSEQHLAELMGNCLATIYIPRDEDFGMSPVESMGAGKPVVGVDEGGIKETVIAQQTGWLLPSPPSSEALISLISGLKKSTIKSMRQNCEKQAQRFAPNHFHEELQQYL